jgi:hypothetical protein
MDTSAIDKNISAIVTVKMTFRYNDGSFLAVHDSVVWLRFAPGFSVTSFPFVVQPAQRPGLAVGLAGPIFNDEADEMLMCIGNVHYA